MQRLVLAILVTVYGSGFFSVDPSAGLFRVLFGSARATSSSKARVRARTSASRAVPPDALDSGIFVASEAR